MHYEILVEDESGKIALEYIVPKILGQIRHTPTGSILTRELVACLED